ncbi:hypothetical protein EDC01DRAFT_635719 [Geopyxis carbonaria]|nr:hypothetical protein EDC01DRAFT_635719 [Geopyxis carbonaria]
MSNPSERRTDDDYEAKNDAYPDDPAMSGNPDESYVGTGIVKDQDADEGMRGMPGSVTNSDAQLKRDDKEAIDERNIMSGGRTRGAGPKGGYREPGDKEGLPGRDDSESVPETGKSNVLWMKVTIYESYYLSLKIYLYLINYNTNLGIELMHHECIMSRESRQHRLLTGPGNRSGPILQRSDRHSRSGAAEIHSGSTIDRVRTGGPILVP